jgi:hypothetical protein
LALRTHQPQHEQTESRFEPEPDAEPDP